MACCGADLMPFKCVSTPTQGVITLASSAPVTTATTPGAFFASAVSIFLMRAWACGERRKATCSHARQRNVADVLAPALRQPRQIGPRDRAADIGVRPVKRGEAGNDVLDDLHFPPRFFSSPCWFSTSGRFRRVIVILVMPNWPAALDILPPTQDIRALQVRSGLSLSVGRTDVLAGGEEFMRTLLLPLRARFIVYTFVLLMTAVLLIAAILLIEFPAGYAGFFVVIPLAAVRGAVRDRDQGPDSDPARGAAQLSAHGAYPFHPGRNSPGDPPVFSRKRKGRHAVFPRQARAGLPARQAGLGQATVRHPERRVCQRLRVAAPFDRPEGSRSRSRSASASAVRAAASLIQLPSSTFRR